MKAMPEPDAESGPDAARPTEEPPPARPEGSLPAQQELDELRSRFQRLAADYQNYQKRALRQIEQAGQFAREDLIKSLLAVLDNFEHTLAKGRPSDDPAALLDGVRIVHDHLLNVLAGHGIQRISVQAGEPFDPSRHEAVCQEESDQYPEHAILRELAAGYVMQDRTLRPVKVSVAKAATPSAAEPETDANGGRSPNEEPPPEDENGNLLF
ncbi:MAG: nucleotide exchange factor GrpE [Sedimentisphaerales bacterium]|nr:nucleotide exchange factor GrpE [Sedimentisphaerales bacterium]